MRYGRGRCGAVPGLIGGEGELTTRAVEVAHGSQYGCGMSGLPLDEEGEGGEQV